MQTAIPNEILQCNNEELKNAAIVAITKNIVKDMNMTLYACIEHNKAVNKEEAIKKRLKDADVWVRWFHEKLPTKDSSLSI